MTGISAMTACLRLVDAGKIPSDIVFVFYSPYVDSAAATATRMEVSTDIRE